MALPMDNYYCVLIYHVLLLQVLILQKHWRRWLAEQFVSSLRAERRKRLEWERQVILVFVCVCVCA